MTIITDEEAHFHDISSDDNQEAEDQLKDDEQNGFDEQIEDEIFGVNVDALLAKELNQLSMEERENILYEIHGVESRPEETSEFVDRKLYDLDVLLVSTNPKGAYQQARQQCPNYVGRREFRLRFLRSERFDVQATAKRIQKHFDLKLSIFGPDLLGKDILFTDLSSEDQSAVKLGFLQLLTCRDQAGRAVIYINPFIGKRCSRNSACRAAWYMQMAMSEDVETQKNGAIYIIYKVNEYRAIDPAFVRSQGNVRDVLPIWRCCVHICYDDPKFRPLISLALLLMGPRGRARFRGHDGGHEECQFILSTFGIPPSVFPVAKDGKLLPQYHQEWVAARQRAEAATLEPVNTVNVVPNVTPGTDRISLPGKFDVLCGRGRSIQDYPGNLRLHHIVLEYQERYEAAKRSAKKDIAMEIVYAIRKNNGRFLKRDPGGYWVEEADHIAREKVSHLFRSLRSRASNQGKACQKNQKNRPIEDQPAEDISKRRKGI